MEELREEGFEVYDFKNPGFEDHGFHWSEIDKDWKSWTAAQFVEGLKHPIAERGFKSDMDALTSSNVCVLVLPCGRSAHLEAGYARGAGSKLYIYNPEDVKVEPELMYKMSTDIHLSLATLIGDLIVFDDRPTHTKRHLP